MSAASSQSGGLRVWISSPVPCPSLSVAACAVGGVSGTHAKTNDSAPPLVSSSSSPSPRASYAFRVPSLGLSPKLHSAPASLQAFECHYRSALQFLLLCERVLPLAAPSPQDVSLPSLPISVCSGSAAVAAAATAFLPPPSNAGGVEGGVEAARPTSVSDAPPGPEGPAAPATVWLEPYPAAVWKKHLPALRAQAAASLAARCSLILAAAYGVLTCERPCENAAFVTVLSALLQPREEEARAGYPLRREGWRQRAWRLQCGLEEGEGAEAERRPGVSSLSAGRCAGRAEAPFFFSTSFFAGFLSSSLASLLRTAPLVLPFYRGRITTSCLPLLLTLDRRGHWAPLLLHLLRYVYTLLLHLPTAAAASAAASREAALYSPAGRAEGGPETPGPRAQLGPSAPQTGPSGGGGRGESKDISPTTHSLTVLRFVRQQLDAVCAHPPLTAVAFFLCSRLLTASTAGGSLHLVGREAEAVVCGVWSRAEGRAAVCLLGGREVVRIMGELARLASVRRSVWPTLLQPPEESLLPLLVARLTPAERKRRGRRHDWRLQTAEWIVRRRSDACEAARAAGAAPGEAVQSEKQRGSCEGAAAGGKAVDVGCLLGSCLLSPAEEASLEEEMRSGLSGQLRASAERTERLQVCDSCSGLCWKQALCLSSPKIASPRSLADGRHAGERGDAWRQGRDEERGRSFPRPPTRSRARAGGGGADPSSRLAAFEGQKKRPRDDTPAADEAETRADAGGCERAENLSQQKRIRAEANGGRESDQGREETPHGANAAEAATPSPSAEAGSRSRTLCEACWRCVRRTRRGLRRELGQEGRCAFSAVAERGQVARRLAWLAGEKAQSGGGAAAQNERTLEASSPTEASQARADAGGGDPDGDGGACAPAPLLDWLLCLPSSMLLMSLLLPPGQVRDLLFLLTQMQLLALPAPPASAAAPAEGVCGWRACSVEGACSLREEAGDSRDPLLPFLFRASEASQQFFLEAFQHNWIFPPSLMSALVAATPALAVPGGAGSYNVVAPQAFAMFAPFVGDLTRFLLLLTPLFVTIEAVPVSPSAEKSQADSLGRRPPAGDLHADASRGSTPWALPPPRRSGEDDGRDGPPLRLHSLRLASPSVVFARWLVGAIQHSLPFPFSVVTSAHTRLALCLDWFCFLPPHLLPEASSACAGSPSIPPASLRPASLASAGALVPDLRRSPGGSSPPAAALDFSMWPTAAACVRASEATGSLLRIALEHSKGTSAKARAAASAAASATAMAQQELRLLASQARRGAGEAAGAAGGGWADGERRGASAPGSSERFSELLRGDDGRQERLAAAREAAKETVRRATAAGLPTLWQGGEFPTVFLQSAVVKPLLQLLLPCEKPRAPGALPGRATAGEMHEAFASCFRDLGANLFDVGPSPRGPSYSASSRLARLLPFGFLAFQLVNEASVLPRDAARLLDFFGNLLASYSPSSLPLFLPSLITALATFGLFQLFLLPGSTVAAAFGRARPPAAALTSAVQNHTLPGLLLRQAGYPVRVAYRRVGPFAGSARTCGGDSAGAGVARPSGAQPLGSRGDTALGSKEPSEHQGASAGWGASERGRAKHAAQEGGFRCARGALGRGPFGAGAQEAPVGLSVGGSPAASEEEESSSRESSQGRLDCTRPQNEFSIEARQGAGASPPAQAAGACTFALYLGGSGAQTDLKSVLSLHPLLLHACVAALAVIAQIATRSQDFRALGAVCWRQGHAAPGAGRRVSPPRALEPNGVDAAAEAAARVGAESRQTGEDEEARGADPALEHGGVPLAVSDASRPFSSSETSTDSDSESAFSRDEDDASLNDFLRGRAARDLALPVLLSRTPLGSRDRWGGAGAEEGPSSASAPAGLSESARPRPASGGGDCDASTRARGGDRRDRIYASFCAQSIQLGYQLPPFLERQLAVRAPSVAGATAETTGKGGESGRRARRRAPPRARRLGSLALLDAAADEKRRSDSARRRPSRDAHNPDSKESQDTKPDRAECVSECTCRPTSSWRRLLVESQGATAASPLLRYELSPAFASSLRAALGTESSPHKDVEAATKARDLLHEGEEGFPSVAASLSRSQRGREGEAWRRANTRVQRMMGRVRRALQQCGGGSCLLKRPVAASSRPQGCDGRGAQLWASQAVDLNGESEEAPLAHAARLLLQRMHSDQGVAASLSGPAAGEGAAGEGAAGERGGASCWGRRPADAPRSAGTVDPPLALRGGLSETAEALCFVSSIARELAKRRDAPTPACLVCRRFASASAQQSRETPEAEGGGDTFEADPEFVHAVETLGEKSKAERRAEACLLACVDADMEERTPGGGAGRLCWRSSAQEQDYKRAVTLWGALLAEMQRRQEGGRWREAQDGGTRDEKGGMPSDQKGATPRTPYVGFILLCLLAGAAGRAASDKARSRSERPAIESEGEKQAPDGERGGISVSEGTGRGAGAADDVCAEKSERRERSRLRGAENLLRVYLDLYGVYVSQRTAAQQLRNARGVVARDLQLGLPLLWAQAEEFSEKGQTEAARGGDGAAAAASPRSGPSPVSSPPLGEGEEDGREGCRGDAQLPSPVALLSQLYRLPRYVAPLFVGQAPLLASVFFSAPVAELEALAARCGLLLQTSARSDNAVADPRAQHESTERAATTSWGGSRRESSPDAEPHRPFFCSLCWCARARGLRRSTATSGKPREGARGSSQRFYPLFTLPSWHLLRAAEGWGVDGNSASEHWPLARSPEFLSVVQALLVPRSLFLGAPSSLEWRSYLLAWRMFARELEVYHLLDPPSTSFLSRPLFPLAGWARPPALSPRGPPRSPPSLASSAAPHVGVPQSSRSSALLGSNPAHLHQPVKNVQTEGGERGEEPDIALSGAAQLMGSNRLRLVSLFAGKMRSSAFGALPLWSAGDVGAASESDVEEEADAKKGSLSSVSASCRSSLVLLPSFSVSPATPLCGAPSSFHLHLLESLLSLLASYFSSSGSASFSAGGGAPPTAPPGGRGPVEPKAVAGGRGAPPHGGVAASLARASPAAEGLLGAFLALTPLVAALRPTLSVLQQTLFSLSCAPPPEHAPAEGHAAVATETKRGGATEGVRVVELLAGALVSWLLQWYAADAARFLDLLTLLKAQPSLFWAPPTSSGTEPTGGWGGDVAGERARRPRSGGKGERGRRSRGGRDGGRKRRESTDDREGAEGEEEEEERAKAVWRAEECGQGVWERIAVQVAAFATRHAGSARRGDSSVPVIRLRLLPLFSPRPQAGAGWAHEEARARSLHVKREGNCMQSEALADADAAQACEEVTVSDVQRLCALLMAPGPAVPSVSASPQFA
ncbi:hypothetical protein BESB_080210 [Besnoitia besnoiti]|uniref:Uncharacterized protein n=1 Tax=Besnoitia besnoiti TaxID=94643 RepID=A0A2A9M737_BESBE|nr:hypothetical protein BESB_080210 [Besnoitia besnoiti]PFH33805.1 hypothetical protein BESB_080210 [Besnoitia besnoiti]